MLRAGGKTKATSWLPGVPAFVGAYLLFVVEPMFAKSLLPTFGGSPAVWSACLASFQILLLAGYGYVDAISRSLSKRAQATAHCALLAVGTVAAIRAGSASAFVFGSELPELGVPLLVLSRLGVPFFVLATTAPLLSGWAEANGGSARSVYAVSNAGALAGLITYPLVLEPFWNVHAELRGWTVAFGVFSIAFVPMCVLVRRSSGEAAPDAPRGPAAPSVGDRVRWVAYAFVPSTLLVAVTNYVTVDVAATPLLWTVPLALYLISFILAFGAYRPSWRAPVAFAWIVGALGLSLNTYSEGAGSLFRELGSALLALTSACVLCHGELASERPRAEHLSRYYLLIALGGALGGAFVGFVAPLVFADYYELELAAIATFLVLLVAARKGADSPWARAPHRALWLGSGLLVPLFLGGIAARLSTDTPHGRIVERRRSFLGALRVLDVAEGRLLTHGRTQHGLQLRDPALRRTPTMYYGPGTGLELAMDRRDHPGRIGVLGLGVGTVAAYGREGDFLRFYELDSNVVDVAERDFTFLADSKATVDVVVGDGRLSLSREPAGTFDILILDAFASDAVPVHLLTREAFSLYVELLVPNGLLIANVSNRHLSVDRAVLGSARENGLECVFVTTASNSARHVTRVEWALASRDRGLLTRVVRGALATSPPEPAVLWTDTRTSLLDILR